MNKALILLLVTLVPSQSDGVLLPNSNTNDGFRDSQLEEWEGLESKYPVDFGQSYRKRSATSDAFTRRSSLDKNFMRFGRGDDAPHCGRGRGKLSFYRFGRGLKDNFIRFGRARDNFIRFGRGGGKDGFIRFGRGRPEDFFRPSKSLRENFIRFGRAEEDLPGSDEDYEESFSSEEPYLRRLEKSSRAQENFMRFGKNGKNGTNFLRFGKSETEGGEEGEEGKEEEEGEGEGEGRERRKRRNADGSSKVERKRATGFFEKPPENFPRKFFPILGTAPHTFSTFRNSRFTSFFPVLPILPKSLDEEGPERKRNQGGSNFIRFG